MSPRESIRPAGPTLGGTAQDCRDQLGGRLGSDSAAEIDEIVGDDPKPDPALHSIVAGISAPVEAMSSLAHTDAALAPGAPSLPVAEPALLLFAPAVGAFGGSIGNADSFDASGLCRDLVLAGVEAGVSGDQVRYTSQHCRMYLDRRNQQIRIIGSLSIHVIVDDDLVLRLLQLHQFAKLSRLGRLAFADHLGRWLEDADDLASAAGLAPENAGLGLAHDLLNPRHHHVEHLTVAFQSCLLDDRRAVLHAVTDLPGEAFGLSHYAAGRLEEIAIGRFQLVPAWRGFATCCPGNLQHPPLHAAAPIAQLRTHRTGQRGDLMHAADQYPHPVAQQAAVSRIMDIALNHRGVDTHLAPLHHLPGLGDLYDPVVYLLDHSRSERNPPASHGLGIGHLASANAGEVAVHQVGADFTLQNYVTPIAHVLEDQQAQNYLGGKTRPAVTATVGVAVRQGLVNCRDDHIILQHHIDVAHPGLLQILDLLSNQPVTEAALQASRLNHAASGRPALHQRCQPCRELAAPRRVGPSKIHDSNTALCALLGFFTCQTAPGPCTRAVSGAAPRRQQPSSPATFAPESSYRVKPGGTSMTSRVNQPNHRHRKIERIPCPIAVTNR